MASQRDKDYHKLRNPEKYLGCNLHEWIEKDGSIIKVDITPEYAEAKAAYDKLHYKYGGKSMVGNKRRRNMTRKSNQKDKQRAHQAERASQKREKLKILREILLKTSKQ